MDERILREKYLGIPYKHRGRDIKGLDCWGFPILAYRDEGIELIDLENYEQDWSYKGKNLFLDNYYKNWEEQRIPKFFDLILFKNGENVAFHAGIYLNHNDFMHCCKAGIVISKTTDPKWKDRICGFYRYNKNIK
jgi:cell wall-associated NlpC family hydrolase